MFLPGNGFYHLPSWVVSINQFRCSILILSVITSFVGVGVIATVWEDVLFCFLSASSRHLHVLFALSRAATHRRTSGDPQRQDNSAAQSFVMDRSKIALLSPQHLMSPLTHRFSPFLCAKIQICGLLPPQQKLGKNEFELCCWYAQPFTWETEEQAEATCPLLNAWHFGENYCFGATP